MLPATIISRSPKTRSVADECDPDIAGVLFHAVEPVVAVLATGA
ncbi:hypothetical protein [Sphingomonas sp. PP-CE-1G-424]|nr:hypothetical protein [Sphingomonas sp. PP-CE-1G-424]